MPSRSRPTLALATAVAIALALQVASAQTEGAVDLPTSMTNDEVGFSIAYPPSWGVTTYPGANQIDFNDGPTFVVVDAFELDALPSRELEALRELILEDLAFFIDDLDVTGLPDQVVAGLDAIGIAYTGADGELQIQGVMLLMTDERYAYVINVEAPAEAFASYEPTFAAMVASFRTGLAD